jgi:LmbE family N-acetylglucosaminyl deacetylase
MTAAKLAAHTIAALALSLTAAPVAASEPPMHAGELAHALDRLATTGRVLYVAAHPDDENTALLAYLAGARSMTVAYLSMTRGGGGQNLIGGEQGDLLDVIRTEELLSARRLDGAVQRFTRARDFGYSKNAAETMSKWGHDEALADVVWVIRTFQPDVVITRFDEEPPNHGHHTASAILAREAFAAAADPSRFPDQLRRGARVWKAERLVHDFPSWRGGQPPRGAVQLDVGAYDPRTGMSYGELAALSRSQHKSQGFGDAGERGKLVEHFVLVAGSRPRRDIFDGIDTSWRRLGDRAAAYSRAIAQAQGALDREHPERALPALVRAHRALDALPEEPRVVAARRSLERVIAGAAGLFVRATAPSPVGVPGTTVDLKLEVVARSPARVSLRRVSVPGAAPVAIDAPLGRNEVKLVPLAVELPARAPISTPYWLTSAPLAGRYQVADPSLIGEPRGRPALVAAVEVTIAGRALRLEAPVVHVWTDQVHGERTRAFLIAPPATVTPQRDAVLFPNRRAADVLVRVRAAKADVAGQVDLGLPAGWTSSPRAQTVKLARAGEETTIRFSVTPPRAGGGPVVVRPGIRIGQQRFSFREDTIDHAHIPLQLVVAPAHVRLVPLALRVPGGEIAYVRGSGDSVAEDLAHVGIPVVELDDAALRTGDLRRFAAVVLGIRAYNTRPAVRAAHERLMSYVSAGGTVVVQYNTNNRLSQIDGPVGPFPLEIGRDRVTDENAAMVAVDPKHPVLRTPNAIGPADFAGWVQERGIYFAARWDPRYQTIFRAHDPGEAPLAGSTLVARHGKGRYVYTGLAFFRQLPAGVPGAYRLFMNLLAGP